MNQLTIPEMIIGYLKTTIKNVELSSFAIQACYADPSLCTATVEDYICLTKAKISGKGEFKIPLTKEVKQNDALASLIFRIYKNKELIKTIPGKEFIDCIKSGKKIVLTLQQLDLLDEFYIRGKIVDETDSAVDQLDIVITRGLKKQIKTTVKDSGTFAFKISKKMLAGQEEKLSIRFQAYRKGKRIKTLPGTERWTPKHLDREIKLIVDRLELETSHSISGTISYANKKPAANIPVQIFNKDFRTQTLLGEVNTDKAGKYKFQYRDAQLQKDASGKDNQRANIFIRTIPENNPDHFTESNVIYKVGRNEAIDLTLPNAQFQVKTEFEEIHDSLAPYLKLNKVKISDTTKKDIQILSGETGISEIFLHYYCLSFLLVDSLDRPNKAEVKKIIESNKNTLFPVEQFFYGILRQKNPTALQKASVSGTLHALYNKASEYIFELPETSVRKSVSSAIENYYIQEKIKQLTGQLIENVWTPLRLLLELNSPRKNSGVSTQFLLRSIGISNQNIALKYIELLHDFDAENVLFFDALFNKGILTRNQIKILRFKIKLEETSYVDREFASFLLNTLAVNSAEELAKLSKERIAAMLKRAGIVLPAALPGKTAEEKLCVLLCLFEFYFPEAYIKSRLLDELPGIQKMDQDTRNKLIKHTKVFLKNNPDFKITQGLHQQDRISKNGDRGLNTTGVKKDFDTILLPYLEKLNRVSRITERESEIRLLLDDGFHSANKIVLAGQQTFVKKYQNKLGQGRAVTLYQAAESITQTAAAVYMDHQISDISVIGSPNANLENELPVWENLFGSISSCACADCESVLSPAAYLVSLFEFLKSEDCFQTKQGEKNALERLFEHRPDLPFINLNCENTETELPYIDIVNELLEEFIDSSAIGWNKQTTRTKDELSVMPEHLNRDAYTKLYNTYNLRYLPYHLALDECRSYLKAINIDRLVLIKTFLPLLTEKEVFGHQDWATEKLALNNKEFELFNVNSSVATRELWAQPGNATWWKPLLKLKTFLKNTGLNSRQAYTLFDLSSVTNKGEFKIESINSENNRFEDHCDLNLLEITGKNNSDFEPLFRKIYIVLRLKEITGWSYYELDEYLIGRNNTVDLQEIAQIIEIQAQLNLSARQVLTFYFSLSNTEYTDYSKDRLKQIPSYMDSVFSLLNSNGEILKLCFFKTIRQQENLILSGSKLSTNELESILGRGRSIRWTDKLSLKSLSYFYRFGVLLRALNISIDEFYLYHKILKLDPFVRYNAPNDNASAANTLEFSRVVKFGKSLDLSSSDLYFILRGEPAQLVTDHKPHDHIAEFFTQTQELTQHIYLEKLSLGKLDENKLENELSTLLSTNFNIDTPEAASKIRDLVLSPDDSLLNLANNDYPWFRFLYRDLELFSRNFDTNHSDFIDSKALRYQNTVSQLIYWNKSVEIISERLSDEFEIGKKHCTQLLIHDFFHDAQNSLVRRIILQNAEPVEQQGKYKLFKKAVLVVNSLKLSTQVLDFVLSYPHGYAEKTKGQLLNCYDLAQCISDENYESDFLQLETLSTLQQLFNAHQIADNNILLVLTTLLRGDGTHIRKSFHRLYKELLDWIPADLDYLIGVEGATSNWGGFGFDIELPLPYLGNTHTNSQNNTAQLIPFLSKLSEIRAFTLSHQHSIVQLQQWSSNHANDLKDSASSVYMAFKKDSDNTLWQKNAAAIRNELREKQRDALVTYLLNKWKLSKPEDLYSKLLLDVEMNACRNTSRIKSAISSTQLFINRILMNLDEQISPLKKAGQKWKWMKQYRIWEAKQKVFFFPENYIVPSLLDTKTPFLEGLENDLLKNELNKENAKEAVITYLEELGKIARLQICGTYEEKTVENDISVTTFSDLTAQKNSHIFKTPQKKILHVIARTWGNPYSYYYRKQDPCGIWTAWEKVDAELEGAQLIPIVYNNRMYVFWPEITQEVDDMGDVLINGVISSVVKMAKLLVDFANMGFQFINGFTDVVEQGAGFATQNLLTGLRNVARSIREMAERIPGIGDGVASDINELAIIPLNDIIATLESEIDPLDFDISDFTALFEDFLSNGDDFIRELIKHHYELMPKKRWNIKLAWCEERQGQWSAKKVSDASLEYEDAIGALFGSSAKSFIFNGKIVTENSLNKIEIKCSTNAFELDLTGSSNTKLQLEQRPVGTFYLENRLSPLRVIRSNEKIDGFEIVQNLTGDLITGIRAEANNLQALALGHPTSESDLTDSALRTRMDTVIPSDYKNSFGFYTTLTGTNQPRFWYQLITPHQYPVPLISGNYFHPIFYQDARNTYFIDSNDSQKANSSVVFKHPYVSNFVSRLDSLNLDGFYSLATQSFEDPSDNLRLLAENVDFSLAGSYSQYNWELFFHTPFIIADRLRQNQKYEQALTWLNFIFNPTSVNSDTSGPTGTSKYWITKPFFETTSEAYQQASIRNILDLDDENSDSSAKQELACLMEKLVENPFNVHLIARYRTTAYQKAVVMLYADILIEWGDHLFRQYTIETITEAFNLYYTALTLLGDRPEILPPLHREDRSYKEKQEAAGSNFLEKLESILTSRDRPSIAHAQTGMTKAEMFKYSNCLPGDDEEVEVIDDPDKDQNTEIIRSLSDGYFCLPYNKKLHAYWDTLEDRMYKIRNCLNIKGELQSLSLFQPEINPELLVKIAAQGGSISNAVDFLNLPPGHYRFSYILEKAYELCGELKSLGAALLSSLEKSDSEALSLIRNTHEQKMLDRVLEVRKVQHEEASLNIKSLQKQIESSTRRKQFYESNLATPLNVFEASQLGLTASSIVLQALSSSTKLAAAVSFLIPEIKGGFVTTLGGSFGGKNIGNASKEGAESLASLSSILSSVGSMVGTMGSYERRMQDWLLQKEVLDIELENLAVQVDSARKRVQIAQMELDNHQLQQQQSREIRDYMKDKFSNVELYNWHTNEISKLFFRTYQLTFDLALQAEKAFQLEMGVDTSNYVQYGRWDSLRKGLLCGEKLFANLKELEIAYMQRDTRRPELTKTVSINMLNPLALLELKTKGSCSFDIPEYIFDLDHPGHYYRQIKSVSISLPCVVGPYTGVNTKLTLESHRIRKNTTILDNAQGYRDLEPAPDDRFIENPVGVNSIATSSAQNDSGMFEFNLRDERYLPFEGAGVISKWRLALPHPDFKQFDYNTITDVLLHINYTARDGGDDFREIVENDINQSLSTDSDDNSTIISRLFSLKHDFPNEWHQFTSRYSSEPTHFKAIVKKEHFNYLTQIKSMAVLGIKFFSVDNENKLVELSTVSDDFSAKLSDISSDLNDPNEHLQTEIEVDGTHLVDTSTIFMIFEYKLI